MSGQEFRIKNKQSNNDLHMSSGSRIEVWDGWRGLAIFLVLFGHFTFTRWIWEERMGVDLFFGLSGMLMSNILFIDRMVLRDFYIRRFSRVIPTLIAFLVVAFIVSVIMRFDFQITELVASLFFIRTYFPVDPSYYSAMPPTGHLWSLSVEEHSYIIMSVLSLFLFSRGKAAMALFSIFIMSVVINFYRYSILPAPEFEFSLIRTESAIGFIAFSAAYNLFRKERSITVHPYLPIVCVLISFACYLDAAPIWLTFLFGPVLLGVAINHVTESAKPLQVILTFAPLRWLGVLSYSIYLWQQVFYRLYYALPGKAVTGFILSIVVGAISFYLFEDPVRKHINKRWSAKPKYKTKTPG